MTYLTPYMSVSGRAGFGAVENSLWPTTGDIDTETASLATQVHQLAQDIFNANVPADDTWSVFQNAWNAFIADFNQWKDAAWFWNLTRRDQLLNYRTKFNALLDKAKSMGIGTMASPQADTGSDPVSKLLGTLTTVAIVVGAAVGGYYAFQIYRSARR
jgi:hypothetical protein